MMMKTRLSLLLTLALLATAASAQYTRRAGILFNNMNAYNPAIGIEREAKNYDISLYGNYTLADNSYWNKPPSMAAKMIGRVGGGFYSAGYLYDGYSFFDRHAIAGGYGYGWRLGEHRLGVGARVLLSFDALDWSKFSGATRQERQLLFTPDGELGLSYQWRGLNVGLAAQNLFATAHSLDGGQIIKNQRLFNATIAYRFQVGKNVVLAPYALLFYERSFSFNTGVYAQFYDKINTSYTFRMEKLRHAFTLGGTIADKFNLDVYFDFSMLNTGYNLEARLGYCF